MPRVLADIQIVEGFPPVNLAGQANIGDWVRLRNYGHVAVKFHSAPGTSGDDPTLVIEQARDVSGAGVKALNFTTIFVKEASGNLANVGQWSEITQVASNSYSNQFAAELDVVWVVEFDGTDLDFNSGFNCVRASVADVGVNSQVGFLEFILSEARYHNSPENMPSAIE